MMPPSIPLLLPQQAKGAWLMLPPPLAAPFECPKPGGTALGLSEVLRGRIHAQVPVQPVPPPGSPFLAQHKLGAS